MGEASRHASMGGQVPGPDEALAEPSDHSVEWFRQVPLRSLRQIWCFPHAGAGAAEFASWAKQAAPGFLVCAVRLPGRERRISEVPVADMRILAKRLAATIAPLMSPGAVFYGQCLGAITAFEVLAELELAGNMLPGRLYVASQVAPQNVSCLASAGDGPVDEDADFRRRVRELGWITADPSEEDSLWQLIERPLKADFSLLESYSMTREQVRIPISALMGSADDLVTHADLEQWGACTTAEFDVEIIQGGHLLSRDSSEQILAILGR